MYNSSQPAVSPSAYQYNPQAQTEDDADNSDLGSRLNTEHELHGQDLPQHRGASYGYREDPSEDHHHNYDSSHTYNLTEDDDTLEKDGSTTLLMARNSSYKPVPLRWPFIATLMTLFLVAIGIIVYAHVAMPNSDSTAHVSELKARDAAVVDDYNAYKRDLLFKRTGGGKIVIITSTVPYTITPTSAVTVVSTVTGVPPATTTTTTRSTATPSYAYSYTTIMTTLTMNGTTITRTYTSTITLGGGQTATATLASSTATAKPTTYPTTMTSVSTGHPYISYGKITITVIDGSTVGSQGDTPTPQPPTPTVVASETTVVFKSVAHGPTETIVTTPDPVTIVSTVAGGVRTSTVHNGNGNGDDLETIVTTVGGTPMTVDMSEVTVVSDSGDTRIVATAPPQSYQDGRPTVVLVGGTVVTLTRTRAPSLVVYTDTPHVTTIVSTPKPTTLTTTHADSTMLSTAVSTVSVSVSAVPSVGISGSNTTGNGRVTITVLELQPADYFVATFLPTIVAVLLSLPLRVIDANAKMYQPFQALTRPGGARGSESLTLEFSGLVGGIKTSFSAAWHEFEFIPLITTLLVLLSSFMAPLATEALGLKLHGSCSLMNESGCAGALGVSVAPAFALVGVLGTMFVLLAVLLALLGWRRWRTGLRTGPWNLAGLASLTACPDLVEGTRRDSGSRRQQRSRVTASERSLKKALADRQFALGVYETEPGRHAYGIVPVGEMPSLINQDLTSDTDTDRSSFLRENEGYDDDSNSSAKQQPFLTLTVAYRVSFIIFLAALLAVDLAYHIAAAGGGRYGSNPITNHFGYFVATNSFGVGFVLAAVGVAISFGWAALLATVATIAPFQAMAMHARPQTAERSVLLPSRPTNEFSSLRTAFTLLGFSFESRYSQSRVARMFPRVRRASDAPPIQHALFLALVAIMTLLSEFLPVLLANVPYRATQTRDSSVACARAVAVVLVLMLVTLVASFVAVRWPALPADPRTLAGSMYYVVDSHALPAAVRELEEKNGKSISLMTTKEKAQCVKELGRRYYYGDIVGRSGRRRLAVDADVSLLDPVLEAASDDGHHQDRHELEHDGPDLASIPTAYQGGPYYVNDHDQWYQRQQQAEEQQRYERGI
ncbi:hypothetical protein F503_06626 [Ophiostoma piceae UAMH 11346]|uniref:Uncharacterized protein n=1 Tax=Ophiostoma piceae (strain UAMH 11346) TaxID=1262450 RepID=S3CB21_OPHP1|nr:hypothetical protein F503_06626 [Ophiostoma piceae UAMH 11346]